ncbi:MAG TPA: hypothetical protein PLY96_16405, partial [Chromatiaceae bacterium]|nr:hypothetical protein [Chromatiaceae bacterium]
MKTHSLTPLLAALVLASCQSVPPQTLEGDASKKVIVRERGIDQVRDEDSGERYFVVCEDCARPTLKTMYRPPAPMAMAMAMAMARIDPVP